jgi:uncharacterized protein (DUF2384 family)
VNVDEQIAALQLTLETMVRESGNPDEFDARRWLYEWLSHPVGALGYRRPADVLLEEDGFERVRVTLLRMQSGAYS